MAALVPPLRGEFHALARARSSLHTLSALPTGEEPTRSAPGGLLGEPLVLGPHRYVGYVNAFKVARIVT